ncbi:MAG: hypothetical protein JKY93_01600 [Gammaproteobacteria bacterium]|nr:hypothetical protein [Gammaproteobacteria bacterium]
MKPRVAVEPIIGHLKSDYRLNGHHLKGKAGDRTNVVLAAAAYSMAKLLVWFSRIISLAWSYVSTF